MPTYNVEKYVEQAVRSILNQTYSNFELIVVDDASSDGTYEILTRLSREDKRIRLFRNEENMKITYSLNYGLQHAKGRYIARMDGDDTCAENRLEQLKLFLEKNQDYSLVGSYVINTDIHTNEVSRRKMIQTYEYAKRVIFLQSPVLHIWMAKKELYDQLGGYRDVPYVEDYDFLLRAYYSGAKFGNVAEYLYSVRWREGNTATTNGIIQQKARIGIKKICKLENKKKQCLYEKNRFNKLLKFSEIESESYKCGYTYLLKAIANKNNKSKMMIYSIIASLKSRYILKHIVETTIVRGIILAEIRSKGSKNAEYKQN